MNDHILKFEYLDHVFSFIKTPTAPDLIKEIFADNYHILQAVKDEKMSIRPGDVIVDAGACEGMFSVLMSHSFPEARILAYEPVPSTYYNLVNNLELNGCKNVKAFNLGLGPNFKQRIEMITNKDGQTGGSTALCTFNPEAHIKVEVGIIPLDAVFELNGIRRIRLLKMDIEGMEYDVLYSSQCLNSVDFFVGEFHINQRLEFESRRLDGLTNWVCNQTKCIFIQGCKMAE